MKSRVTIRKIIIFMLLNCVLDSAAYKALATVENSFGAWAKPWVARVKQWVQD